MNERERERKKEKRFSATTRGAERIERKKNSYHHRKKTNLVKKDVVEQTGAPFGFEKHLEGKTRADGNDERTTERSKQKERRW